MVLLSGPRDVSWDLRTRLFEIQMASGETTKAAENLELATTDPKAPERTFVLLIAHYAAENNPGKELAASDRYLRRFRAREEEMLPRRIELLNQLNRTAEAGRVLRQCLTLGEKKPDLASDCQATFDRRSTAKS